MAIPISAYAPGAAALGGVAGAGAGGLLGRLGQLLEPLDYPRQAAWNFVQGAREGSLEKMLPGMVGAATGLAATPFIGPAGGVGVGSLFGGLTQGAMKSFNPEAAQAPTPGELVKALGGPDDNPLLNMGVGMALDPLTYAGGLGGASKGLQFGQGLESAALKQGLGYSDDVGKLAQNLTPEGVDYMKAWGWLSPAERPALQQVAAEIPEGSQFLGHGGEAFVYRRPDAGVVRISRPGLGNQVSPVQAPEMLQPAREAAIGPYHVAHVPTVETLGDARRGLGIDHLFGVGGQEIQSPEIIRQGLETPEGLRNLQPALGKYDDMESAFEQAATGVGGSAEKRGLYPWDVYGNPENVGRTAEGNWVTHDLTAIDAAKDVHNPFQGVTPEEPTGATSWLLSLLGSKQALRDQVSRMAGTTAGQGINLPGM